MKKIVYKFLSCEINHGTEEEPNIEPVFLTKEIQCAADALEANYVIAEKEAYNGEITVEEIPGEETGPDEMGAIMDALCEMDAANEARFAAIEDALCEMDSAE